MVRLYSQGDSGGPLVVEDAAANSGYRLVGIVSWGNVLCSADYPAGYAKVSANRDWFDANIAYD